jgi:kynurenine formamidase
VTTSRSARPTSAPSPVETLSLVGREVRVIDLSQRLSNSTSDNEPMPHRIEYFSHAETAQAISAGMGLSPEAWQGGAWAYERVTLTTHSGTHLDAPYHYTPTTNTGEPTRPIDEVPFQWVMGDAVVLNMTHCSREQGITLEDVRAELSRIGYRLKPFDIVLVRTDISRRFDEPGYDQLHPGLRREATAYLVEQGVKLIGIDAWGLDRPMAIMAAEAAEGDLEQLWESHKYGAANEYCQIEKLCNLDQLPEAGHGFQVLALPVRLEGASGAWARVVALVPTHQTAVAGSER